MTEGRSFFLIFIQFPGNNLDKLLLVDRQLFLHQIFFLDGFAIGTKNKLFNLLFGEVLVKIFNNFCEGFLCYHLIFVSLVDE